MGAKTDIEWCDSSANLMAGCAGCELWNPHAGVKMCYAGLMTERWAGMKGWPESFDKPVLFPERAAKACNWPDLTGKDRPGKPWLNGLPRHIFWNDMGDTWTTGLPLDWLKPYIKQMEESKHVNIFLTKRVVRMTKFFQEVGYVPSNFLIGATVTSQATFGRITAMLDFKRRFPNAKIWISAEPILGNIPIDPKIIEQFNWVVAGGASGQDATTPRMHPEYVRRLRDTCVQTGTKFFFKQWGDWIPKSQVAYFSNGRWEVGEAWKPLVHNAKWGCLEIDGDYRPETTTWNGRQEDPRDNYETTMYRVGTKHAGSLLDGASWKEMP